MKYVFSLQSSTIPIQKGSRYSEQQIPNVFNSASILLRQRYSII